MTSQGIINMNHTAAAREAAKERYWDAYYATKAELDEALKTLSYRTTDSEYSTFVNGIRDMMRPVAIEAVKREIERVNKVSAPEVLAARDRLEMACRDFDHIKETYGENNNQAFEASDNVRKADAALEAIIWTATNHPEILDAAADDQANDALRHGG